MFHVGNMSGDKLNIVCTSIPELMMDGDLLADDAVRTVTDSRYGSVAAIECPAGRYVFQKIASMGDVQCQFERGGSPVHGTSGAILTLTIGDETGISPFIVDGKEISLGFADTTEIFRETTLVGFKVASSNSPYLSAVSGVQVGDALGASGYGQPYLTTAEHAFVKATVMRYVEGVA